METKLEKEILELKSTRTENLNVHYVGPATYWGRWKRESVKSETEQYTFPNNRKKKD